MNFIDELRNLDLNDIGRWPVLFRAIFIAIFFVAASVGGFYFLVYEQQMPRLEQAQEAYQKAVDLADPVNIAEWARSKIKK